MAQEQRPQQQYTNRSRLSLGSPAIRPGMKGKILLAGPSGAGKTYTSLLIATILAGPERTTRSIYQLDTEKDSGKTYADLFRLPDGSEGYYHVPWAAPYNATDLAMTLDEASADPEISVVIVDSHSHFWRAEGGILDVAGGKWTGWDEARPMHAKMIDAVLNCDCHVILCARQSMEHVQEKDANGKITVRKVGMKVQQDAELEFEVNLSIEMDKAHVMHVSKSRTLAVPVGTQYISGYAEQFAGEYRDWLVGGEPVTTKEQQVALIEVLNRIEDGANRKRSKRLFVETFGRPEMLLVSRLEQAQEWVADQLLGETTTPDRAPDEEPPDERTKQPEATDEEKKAAAAQAPKPAPSENGAPKPAEEQSGARSATESDPPAPTVGEVRKALEDEVKALKPLAVSSILTDRGLPLTGNPAALRKRLVDFLLDVRDGARIDPKACPDCGGATTDVCPPGQVFCKCGTI